MGKNLYICGTHYHIFMATVRVLVAGEEADMIVEDTALQSGKVRDKLRRYGIFEKVSYSVRKNYPLYESQNRLCKLLFEHKMNKLLLGREMDWDFFSYDKVYLFNDRTVFGKYLIDIKRDYILLEDGVNYFSDLHRVNFRKSVVDDVQDMLSVKPNFKEKLKRFFNYGYRTLGQSRFCTQIEVNDASDLFLPLDKVVEVPQKELISRLSEEDKKTICNIFLSENADDLKQLSQPEKKMLLLTQPLEKEKMLDNPRQALQLYHDLIEEYGKEHIVYIKPHPRENTNYLDYMKNIIQLGRNWPIEILNFIPEIHFDLAITVTSSGIYGIDFSDKTILLGEEILETYKKADQERTSVSIDSFEEFQVKNARALSVENVHVYPEIVPIVEGSINVVLSCSNQYARILPVLLRSILENASESHVYDIIILNQNISETNKKMLENIFSEERNFYIRFFDCTPLFSQERLYTKLYMTIETWFRLCIPYVMRQYKKAVYLDCDMIVNHDIAELFEIDFAEQQILAAVRCPTTAGSYNDASSSKRKYLEDELGLKHPKDYFQAGTIVFNLEAMRDNFSFEVLLQFAMSRNWDLVDQDFLNLLAEGRVQFLPMEWNVLNFCQGRKAVIELADDDIYQRYMESREHPKIVHFAGSQKPWNCMNLDMQEYFWRYARRTDEYEKIIFNLLNDYANKQIRKSIRENQGTQKRFTKVLPLNTVRREAVKSIGRKLKLL